MDFSSNSVFSSDYWLDKVVEMEIKFKIIFVSLFVVRFSSLRDADI
jgi:hypothetical protein